MAYDKRTIDQIDVAGKTVLMRVDFNVPLNADGAVADDTRIVEALPSVRCVLDGGGRLVLLSHLGRPKGGVDPALSLAPVADRLSSLLSGRTVGFPAALTGADVQRAVQAMGDGEVILLENTRFDPREKAGDATLAAELAPLGDVYCNNAFGTSHRQDVTMYALAEAMESKPRVAGALLDKELRTISGVLENPTHPFVAVLGGAKVSDKLGAIHNLMNRVDAILIGGAMAYTILQARGVQVGASLVEEDRLDDAGAILKAAAAGSTELVLPIDHVCGRTVSADTPTEQTDGAVIGDGWMGLDIGPQTVDRFATLLRSARTIVWNGPVGVFEVPPFHQGTLQVARAIAEATAAGATTVVGGGDSVAAIHAARLEGGFSHISTGGGASLRMLEGKGFPAVDLLDDA